MKQSINLILLRVCLFLALPLLISGCCDADSRTCTKCTKSVCSDGSTNPSCINDSANSDYKKCIALPNHAAYEFHSCECRCKSGWGGPNCDSLLIPCSPSVSDADGSSYDVVKRGQHCWMKQNLRTTRYNDGSLIPTGLSRTAWQNTSTGASAVFNDSEQYASSLGRFYNHIAVATGKLCPAGWHVATKADFEALMSSVGGQNKGAALKAIGMWPVNDSATNTSNFTAVPAGLRGNDGNYYSRFSAAHFWSSTIETADPMPLHLFVADNNDNLISIEGYPANNGHSCRCVRD